MHVSGDKPCLVSEVRPSRIFFVAELEIRSKVRSCEGCGLGYGVKSTKLTHGITFSGGELSHMTQGASPAPECIARLDHSSTTPRSNRVPIWSLERQLSLLAIGGLRSAVIGESTSPREGLHGS
jgi:hypothetical protein